MYEERWYETVWDVVKLIVAVWLVATAVYVVGSAVIGGLAGGAVGPAAPRCDECELVDRY